MRRSLIVLSLYPLAALAQPTLPTEFPAGAAPLAAEALQARLAGKVFRVKLADGNSWRLEFKANGYAYVDTSSGYRDSGKWRVEGSTFCDAWQKQAAAGCNEARLAGDTLLVKRRSNGEIIALSE